ncbi:winged helix-turn-helix domain-containing protein [Actibacterium sp. XHP0104]|uniref:winged helix-turn-helix domain-containing protein n=1 Tax=Actibacterium sp. XHP0104 TaxID=2984335 RepID=UPI0021E91FC2|nr:response regulator transcription factor [Actibacterium sp. XHP0104]MCV2881581.1 response regulator transcription factor [Actibacterium sp. XHP0104]
MKTTVFLLEDDLDITRLIVRTLSQQGIDTRSFRRISEFEREIKRQLPDLCLIDLSLPDGDGLSLVNGGGLPCSVPRIIVTGRGGLTDKVVGLEIGADDYIVKPFEPRELVARVRAVLRRSAKSATPAAAAKNELITFGDWSADFDGCTLTHRDGEVINLSSSEAALLGALVNSAGRVLSRSQLLDITSGRTGEPFDRSMDARISRLRRKLRDDPKAPSIIRTVYGAGYVFSIPVDTKAG